MGKNRRRKPVRHKSSDYSSGYAIPVLAIFFAIVLYVSLGNFLSQAFHGNGILGEKTFLAKGGEDSGSDGGGSESSGSSADTSGTSGSSQTSTVKTETRDRETGIRTQTETKQDEIRTEVRLSEAERIKTRTKDGLTRIDITQGGIKTRFEQKDDRTIVKAEREDGTEVELEDDTILKIDERLAKDQIKITTAGDNEFMIQRGQAGAVTKFPLSVDLATNKLTITTAKGEKTVAILPDQAIQNIIAANIVSRIGGQAVVDEAVKGNLSQISDIITLGERNGVPIYEIVGISDQKLLGFIPIPVEKTVVVSAQTGEIVSTEQSLTNQITDFFSF